MPVVHIKFITVIVAALINMGIGALWYSPWLFGPAWAKSMGKKFENLNTPSPAYMLMLFGALLQAYVLVHIVNLAVDFTAMDGARTGLWVGLGFVVPAIGGITLFEKRSWRWFAIVAGYYLLSLMVTGALLVKWG